MSKDFQGEVEARIRTCILRRLEGAMCHPGEIAIDTPILGKGLGLDSVDLLALVTEIECEFDILFDDEELTVNRFENIGTLAECVKKKFLK